MTRSVSIQFDLLEEITPEIFLERVALGLARSGTLYTGEMVTCAGVTWEICDPVDFDLFDSGNPIPMPHIKMVE